MFELYRSEMQRLATGAVIACLVLMAAYQLAPKLGFWEILHRNMGFLLTAGAIVLSLGFGTLHSLLWKKKNYWVFLIHRPLSPSRIYLSLLGSGVTVILMTISASLLITTLGYDLASERVVDARHYVFTGYLTFLSVACYMVGTLTLLHRSKFVILCFYALAIAFFPEPQNALAQYLPLMLALLALLYLNIQSFKPDLQQPISSPLGTGLLVTATSYGLVVGLILLTALIYHLPLTLLGKHPDSNPVDGSLKAMWLDRSSNGIAYLLAESQHPRADHYARQASLALRRSLPIQRWQPVRHQQLHRFDVSDSLYNDDTGEVWKFSHDQMLLHGIDSTTKQSVGFIGRNGWLAKEADATANDRFESVPHLSGGEYLSTQQALYKLDFESHSLILKHTTEPGEFYTSALSIVEGKALISTSQKMLMFDVATLQDDFSALHVDHRFTYPDSVAHAEYGFGIPVADGYLLAFIGNDYFGFDRPGAEVFVTRLDGSSEQLGRREFLIHDHPSLIRHYNFMIAPFVFASEELLMHSIDPHDNRFLSLDTLRTQRYPNSIYAAAMALQLLSIALLYGLLRRHRLRGPLRRTWLGLVTVLGVPALLSYLLLQPLRAAR